MKKINELNLSSLTLLLLSPSFAMEEVNPFPLNTDKGCEIPSPNFEPFHEPRKAESTPMRSGKEIDWQKDEEVLRNRIKNGDWSLFGEYADTLGRLGKYEEAAKAAIQAAIYKDYNWACEIWGLTGVDIPNQEEQELEGAKFPSPEELAKATKLLAEKLAKLRPAIK